MQDDREVFRRALGWLGVKYGLAGINQINIVDADNLIEGLANYSTDVSGLMKRKTGK